MTLESACVSTSCFTVKVVPQRITILFCGHRNHFDQCAILSWVICNDEQPRVYYKQQGATRRSIVCVCVCVCARAQVCALEFESTNASVLRFAV